MLIQRENQVPINIVTGATVTGTLKIGIYSEMIAMGSWKGKVIRGLRKFENNAHQVVAINLDKLSDGSDLAKLLKDIGMEDKDLTEIKEARDKENWDTQEINFTPKLNRIEELSLAYMAMANSMAGCKLEIVKEYFRRKKTDDIHVPISTLDDTKTKDARTSTKWNGNIARNNCLENIGLRIKNRAGKIIYNKQECEDTRDEFKSLIAVFGNFVGGKSGITSRIDGEYIVYAIKQEMDIENLMTVAIINSMEDLFNKVQAPDRNGKVVDMMEPKNDLIQNALYLPIKLMETLELVDFYPPAVQMRQGLQRPLGTCFKPIDNGLEVGTGATIDTDMSWAKDTGELKVQRKMPQQVLNLDDLQNVSPKKGMKIIMGSLNIELYKDSGGGFWSWVWSILTIAISLGLFSGITLLTVMRTAISMGLNYMQNSLLKDAFKQKQNIKQAEQRHKDRMNRSDALKSDAQIQSAKPEDWEDDNAYYYDQIFNPFDNFEQRNIGATDATSNNR